MDFESFYESFNFINFDVLCEEVSSDSWVPTGETPNPKMNDQPFYEADIWKTKLPDAWTTQDILHWACNEASINNKNYQQLNLHNFSDVTTNSFRDMSLEECIERAESSEDGQFFFTSKENLYRNHSLNELPYHQYPPHSTPYYPDEPSRLSCSSSGSISDSPPPPVIPVKRGRGRPKDPKSTRRTPAASHRMGKLWEFLRNLLLDSKTCPSLIKWDNHDKGTFKFVKSEEVAKIWGNRKKNPDMNYEKLSRAMRYYYKSKVLLPVHGKRLVYQFGPQATGWRTENPILDDDTNL